MADTTEPDLEKLFDVIVVGTPAPPYIATSAPSSHPAEIRCYECGFLYGPLIGIIHSCMEVRQLAFLKATGVLPLFAVALAGGVPAVGDLLDCFRIFNHCCRRVFTTMRHVGQPLYIPKDLALAAPAGSDADTADDTAADTAADTAGSADDGAESAAGSAAGSTAGDTAGSDSDST